MADLLFLNGEILPLQEGRVSVEDRGFQFADGVYDVIRCYGGSLFALRQHLERLKRSAAGLMLDLPYSLDRFEQICRDLVRQSALTDAKVYIQVTRGTAARVHYIPESISPTVVIYTSPMPQPNPALWERGVRVIGLPDERWNRCELKTIALLPNVLAKQKARRAGVEEALLCSPERIVYEGSSSNVFFVLDEVLFTHPLTSKVLPGITRRIALELASDLGLKVEEVPRTIDDFAAGDEVFLTGTAREIQPVVQIDDRKIRSGQAGPITRQLQSAFQKRVAAECGHS